MLSNSNVHRILCAASAIFVVLMMSGSATAETMSVENAAKRHWASCPVGAAVGGAAGGYLANKFSKKIGIDKPIATGLGIAAGATAGCVLFDKLSQADTKQVEQVEAEAAQAGSSQRSWPDADGQIVTVNSTSTPVEIQGRPELSCKKVQSDIARANTAAATSERVYCEDSDGSQKPADTIFL